jgi:hypothetical protein
MLLVLLLARHRVGPLRSAVVAACFGCVPCFYAIFLQATGLGEAAALAMLLLGVLLNTFERALPVLLGVIAMFLSVLCKETAGLVAVVVLVFTLSAEPGGRVRSIRLAGLLSLLALGGFLLATKGQLPSLNGPAYEVQWRTSVEGLAWYLGQILLWPAMSPDLRGRMGELAQLFGVLFTGLSFIWVWKDRDARCFWIAGLAALVPILPLDRHRVASLVYIPSAMIVLSLALGSSRRSEPDTSKRPLQILFPIARGFVAVALVLAFVIAAGSRVDLWLGARSSSGLPADPFLRKMFVGEIAIQTFRSSAPDPLENPGRRTIQMGVRGTAPTVVETRGARNLVRDVLDDGLALRLYRPGMRRIEWVDEWRPSLLSSPLVLVDGSRLIFVGTGAEALQAVARNLDARGETARAIALLSDAMTADPHLAVLGPLRDELQARIPGPAGP